MANWMALALPTINVQTAKHFAVVESASAPLSISTKTVNAVSFH
jgi:hypothetical protein